MTRTPTHDPTSTPPTYKPATRKATPAPPDARVKSVSQASSHQHTHRLRRDAGAGQPLDRVVARRSRRGCPHRPREYRVEQRLHRPGRVRSRATPGRAPRRTVTKLRSGWRSLPAARTEPRRAVRSARGGQASPRLSTSVGLPRRCGVTALSWRVAWPRAPARVSENPVRPGRRGCPGRPAGREPVSLGTCSTRRGGNSSDALHRLRELDRLVVHDRARIERRVGPDAVDATALHAEVAGVVERQDGGLSEICLPGRTPDTDS